MHLNKNLQGLNKMLGNQRNSQNGVILPQLITFPAIGQNNKKMSQVCFENLRFRQFETGDDFLFVLSK